MNSWYLEETQQQIIRLYGPDQFALAGPCIRSVDDRQTYARIHYEDLQELLDGYWAKSQDASPLFLAWVAGGNDGLAECQLFVQRVGAHLIACIQSMHSMPDILAHMIYYSLALNRRANPLPLRKIGICSVISKLQYEVDTVDLRKLLNVVSTGGSFAHISALANHCKHRSLVFPAIYEDWTGERADRLTIMLPAFEYEGESYPQVVAMEFLEAEYERCFGLVVQVRNELNALLRRRGS